MTSERPARSLAHRSEHKKNPFRIDLPAPDFALPGNPKVPWEPVEPEENPAGQPPREPEQPDRN